MIEPMKKTKKQVKNFLTQLMKWIKLQVKYKVLSGKDKPERKIKDD